MLKHRESLRIVRYAVQFAFLLLTLFVGFRFFAFVRHFEEGTAFVTRPPSVDGFLPIAGFMSLKYFLSSGTIEPFHPAAMVIFSAAVLVSLLAKKGFCGWVCPVGTVSQYVWMAGEKILGRNFRVHRFPDIAVRSVKYLLMAFFLVLIGVTMAPHMIFLFFLGDYYKVADVKTMKFFTEMSSTAFWTLSVLAGLSLLYKNVWCRYLCPYGALLGLVSRWSPLKIRRDEAKCVHCRACSRHCPSLIDVEKQDVVKSAECYGCLTCVSRCPAAGALDVVAGAGKHRRVVPPLLLPAAVLAIWFTIIGTAMITGHWQSAVPYEEYQRIIPLLDQLAHP